jgi:hypothetical protein
VYLAYLLQKFSNLASITIRDNPMGRDMRASYVTAENALLLTGGFASEPPAVISAVGDANRSPGKGKGGAHNTTGAKSLPKSNFNGTSDVLASSSPISAARALALQNWEEEASYSAAAESSLSPSSLQQRQQQPADIDVALSTATAVVASERTSRNATCLHTTVSTEENVFVPGMTASVRPIKRTHELHRVEDNISAFPVTDTQLRQKFVALDKDCCGYVDPETFLKAYNELDPVSAELPDKRVTKMVEKLCPGGKIGFQEFSVMILKLVNA